MANPASIIAHLRGDAERQRNLARMQQLRNEAAAYSMMRVAATLQDGATSNAAKGVLPFALINAARGVSTVAVASPQAGHTIYTAAPPAPQRRRRGRR